MCDDHGSSNAGIFGERVGGDDVYSNAESEKNQEKGWCGGQKIGHESKSRVCIVPGSTKIPCTVLYALFFVGQFLPVETFDGVRPFACGRNGFTVCFGTSLLG